MLLFVNVIFYAIFVLMPFGSVHVIFVNIMLFLFIVIVMLVLLVSVLVNIYVIVSRFMLLSLFVLLSCKYLCCVCFICLYCLLFVNFSCWKCAENRKFRTSKLSSLFVFWYELFWCSFSNILFYFYSYASF